MPFPRELLFITGVWVGALAVGVPSVIAMSERDKQLHASDQNEDAHRGCNSQGGNRFHAPVLAPSSAESRA